MKKLTNIFDLFLQTRIQKWVFVFGVFCSSVSFSQTVFTEGFEGGTSYPTPSGWNTSGSWTINNGGGHTGSNYARLSAGQTNRYLFTQTFTATVGWTYNLSYWDIASGSSGNSLAIYVSNLNPGSQSIANTNSGANYIGGTNSGTSSTSWLNENSTDWVCPASGTYFFAFVATTGSSSAVMRIDDVVLTKTAPSCTAPSTIPSAVNTSFLSSQYATVNWNPGSGDNSLVVVSPGALSSLPANGISYTGNSAYGAGSALGNGYVVYNGSASTVSINSLVRNTSYTVTIFTYNNTATCYNTTPATLNFNTTNGAGAFYVDDNSNLNDVYTVGSTSGSDATEGKRLTPFASLTKAFTVVQAGDTIYVDAGTYSDALNKDLNLPVTGLKILGAGMQLTIFDNGSNSDHYFMRIDKNNTTLSDMTIRSYAAQTCGGGANGQALGVIGATGVNIINVLVDKTATSSDGCGYPIEVKGGASATFQGGGATCNNYLAGGGIRVTGPTTVLTIKNYLFYGNSKYTDNGASLHVTDGNVIVQNTKFKNNESRNDKRGAGVYQTGGTMSVFDCEFDQNITWLAYDQVGGTILVTGGNFTIKRSVIKNHTQLGGSTSYGAGIGVMNGTAYIDSCYFEGNDGDLGHATDIFTSGGNVFVRNCSLSSASNRIGSTGGTTTINNSGSFTPSYSVGMTFLNTLDTSYTANPTVPQFIGDCPTGITILPVELSSFTGKCLDGMGALTWTTDSEHNNAYFTVERSQDDNDYTALSFVNGAINTTEKSEYRFLDTEMQKGTNYYRLSQTDLDGQTRILETIAIENNCFGNGLEETAFVVDAVNNQVLLLMNVEHKVNFEFTLTDNMGRLLLHKDLTADPHQNKVTILLPDSMAAGVYHLTVTDGSIRVNNKVFMNK
ncbi:MAG: hypothetical protein EP305_10590 [Bacteroidetes bacterium]|nr:MAG: hypothetical protein EP305_10590 [Bacteroidota bacterium]